MSVNVDSGRHACGMRELPSVWGSPRTYDNGMGIASEIVGPLSVVYTEHCRQLQVLGNLPEWGSRRRRAGPLSVVHTEHSCTAAGVQGWSSPGMGIAGVRARLGAFHVNARNGYYDTATHPSQPSRSALVNIACFSHIYIVITCTDFNHSVS